VGPDEARRFVLDLQAKNYSPGTINQRLVGIRALYRALRWAGVVDEDPFHDVSVRDAAPQDRIEPIPERDLAKLLRKANAEERALILLGSDAGLRISEVHGLRWGDLTLEDPRPRVLVRNSKGDKTAETYLSERAADALVAIHPGLGAHADEPVFEYSQVWLNSMFRRACKRARVGKPYHFHQLRHRAAMVLLKATGNLTIVQRHLRHSSLRATEYYVGVLDEDLQDAVYKMPS
jgi:integrase/recombinase XerC